MDHKALGAAGETAAVQHLQAAGYRVLARNLRLPGGELDVVAEQGDTLVFIEVKTRRSQAFGGAAAAVDRRKQSRLILLAQRYLQRTGASDRACRFDVVTVEWSGTHWRVEIIANAFGA